MAIFNPQIQPAGIPDYSKYSKDITPTPYGADTSKGQVLSGIASGLENTAKVAESTMEDYLKEKVSAGVDTLRDVSINAYQDVRNSQVTGTAPADAAVSAAGFKGSLVKAGDDADVPDSLQAGLDRAQNIGIAKSQRGGANDTLYTAQLYALTKQLRAEYPGHKDFIDETIAKVSGKNPANAYMSNLLADINHASTGQDTFQKTIMSKAAANLGEADVQKYFIAAQQGLPGAMANLTDAVFKAESVKAQNERWKVQHDQTQGNQQDDATKASGQAELRAQQIIDQHLEPVITIPGLTAPTTMKKLVDDSVMGRVSLDATQKDQLVQMLTLARSQADEDMQKKFDSEGYSSRIRNPKATEDIRTSKLAYFDRSIAAINSDKFGTFYEERRRNLADQDHTNRQINTSPIGESTRIRARLNEQLGPNWMNYLDSLGMNKNYLQQLQTFQVDSMGRASVSDDIRKDGVIGSMYSDLDAARKAKIAGAKAPDKVYDDVVDNIQILHKAAELNDPKDLDVAKQAVKYTFDPNKNQRIVEFFGRDFTDDKGVLHKGKFAMYDTLTQPRTTDSIAKLKDPASAQMYKDWQEISFKTLFGEEVQNLNKIQGDQSMPMKIKWDSDNHRIIPEFGKPTTTVEANYVKWAQDSINKLNGGLRNLSYMHDKLGGGETNAYLYDVLNTLGYSPNDRMHGDNLPQKMVEAIAASSKSNKRRIEDAFKASRGE